MGEDNIVKLTFEMVVACDEKFADELGEDIAHDILCELYNGEDTLDIKYKGHSLIK